MLSDCCGCVCCPAAWGQEVRKPASALTRLMSVLQPDFVKLTTSCRFIPGLCSQSEAAPAHSHYQSLPAS